MLNPWNNVEHNID